MGDITPLIAIMKIMLIAIIILAIYSIYSLFFIDRKTVKAMMDMVHDVMVLTNDVSLNPEF
jgi:uncharacterized membrane protein (DUF106 family)